MDNPREQVISNLDDLSDEEVVAVLHYIEAMESNALVDDYDVANDPTVGMLSGPTDLARRTEEILYEGKPYA